MRKHLLLLFGLFVGLFPALAQMLPDSTVQVVAYWELGDKQQYLSESAKYKVDQGDTTLVEKSVELLEFEVVAANEDGYRIKVTQLDGQNSDPIKSTLSEKWKERFGPEVYYFETGPNGEFLRMLPIENLEEKVNLIKESITESLGKEHPDIAPTQLLPLVTQLLSPQSLLAAAEGEYSPLFMYHGSRLDLRQVYTFEDEIPSVFGQGTTKMNGRFWVDEDMTDDYSVVLRLSKEADQDALKPFITGLLGGLLQKMDSGQGEQEDVQAAIEEAYKNARISLEDYIYEEIHLGTGWPLDWFFSRESQVELDGKKQGEVREKSFRIIVDDEE